MQLQFKLAPPVGEPVSLAVMCMGSDTDDHSADTASARRTLRAWGWAVRGEPAVTTPPDRLVFLVTRCVLRLGSWWARDDAPV